MSRTEVGMLRIRPMPGVTPHVRADGRMELHCARTGRRFCCDGFGAAAWIALRQHGGDPRRATRTLAEIWGDDEVFLRAELDLLVAALRNAGLVSVVGDRTPQRRRRPPASARRIRYLRPLH